MRQFLVIHFTLMCIMTECFSPLPSPLYTKLRRNSCIKQQSQTISARDDTVVVTTESMNSVASTWAEIEQMVYIHIIPLIFYQFITFYVLNRVLS